MNPHQEELASLYVLDRLDDTERAAFETQLRQSPELVDLVRELEAALEHEVRSLPQHPPPADLFARIESRLDGETAPAPAPTSRAPWLALARWGIAAVIALSLGTLAVQSLRRSAGEGVQPMVLIVGLDAQGSVVTEMPLPESAHAGDGAFIQLAALAEDLWNNPAEIPFASPAAAPAASGYALFEPMSNQGFIAIRHLPSPGPGRLHCLWIVDTATGRVTRAGVLPATPATSGLYSFAVPAPREAKPAQLSFFVTAEDVGMAKATEPHGEVVLGDRRT